MPSDQPSKRAFLQMTRKSIYWIFIFLILSVFNFIACTSYVKKYEKDWLTDEANVLNSDQIGKLKETYDALLNQKGIILWVVIKDTVSKHFLLPELHRFFFDYHPNIKQDIPWYKRYLLFKSEKDKTLLLYIQREPTVFYTILGKDLKDSNFESKVHDLIQKSNEAKDASNQAILHLVKSIEETGYKKPSWFFSNLIVDAFREAWDLRFFGAYLFDAYLLIANSMFSVLGKENSSLIFIVIFFTIIFSYVGAKIHSFEKAPSLNPLQDITDDIVYKIGVIVLFGIIYKNPAFIPILFVISRPSFLASLILIPIICLVDILLNNNIAGIITINNTSHLLENNLISFIQTQSFAELFNNRLFGFETLILVFLFLLHLGILVFSLAKTISNRNKIKRFISGYLFGISILFIIFYLPTRFLSVSFSLVYVIPILFHLSRISSFNDLNEFAALSRSETEKLIQYSQNILLLSLIPIFIVFLIF